MGPSRPLGSSAGTIQRLRSAGSWDTLAFCCLAVDLELPRERSRLHFNVAIITSGLNLRPWVMESLALNSDFSGLWVDRVPVFSLGPCFGNWIPSSGAEESYSLNSQMIR